MTSRITGAPRSTSSPAGRSRSCRSPATARRWCGRRPTTSPRRLVAADPADLPAGARAPLRPPSRARSTALGPAAGLPARPDACARLRQAALRARRRCRARHPSDRRPGPEPRLPRRGGARRDRSSRRDRLGLDIGSLARPRALRALAALRHASRWGVITDGLNRLFSNDNPALRLVRDVGLGLVDRLPALKRMFIREAAGDGGELPRLLRGEAI